MIERYNIKEISDIWSDHNRYSNWLKIEIAVLEYYEKMGRITSKDMSELKKTLSFDVDIINENEKITKHDIFAFIQNVSNSTQNPAKKWLHYGITSSDIVDTANALAFKQTNDIIYKELILFLELIEKVAKEHKDTVQMGRTHGVHAEVTSFGLKFAIYYEEMKRNLDRFTLAREQIEVGKISGAVGTFANTGTELQYFVCQKLNIFATNVSSQVIQRDRYAFYFSTLNIIGRTINKIASELRHLARTELGEISEGFALNQKGSSAMPHKKNPISLENVCGLSRLLLGYDVVAQLNVDLWDERDISHSSAERITTLDATVTLVYILRRMCNILVNMVVHKERMVQNIESDRGLCFSQTILLKLLGKNTLDRLTAYNIIQSLTLKCIKENIEFKSCVTSDSEVAKYLSKEEVESCFEYSYHLKHVDTIFSNVFQSKEKSVFKKIHCYKWEIDFAINKVASWLNAYYINEQEPVYIYTIMNGSIVFTGQLLTKLRFKCKLKPVKLSFYGDKITFTDKKIDLVKLIKNPAEIKNKKILLLDDLIDLGKTMKILKDHVESLGVAEVKTCVLCDKQVPTAVYHADWTGMLVPNVWISGYGADYMNEYRNADFFGEPNIKE